MTENGGKKTPKKGCKGKVNKVRPIKAKENATKKVKRKRQ